mgnify:CR=1 FL=1
MMKSIGSRRKGLHQLGNGQSQQKRIGTVQNETGLSNGCSIELRVRGEKDRKGLQCPTQGLRRASG